jgi:hypothetical protein
MAEFPALKDALFRWANDARVRLSADSMAHYRATDLGHWRRDADGAFRDIERSVEIWDRPYLDRQFDLPTWAAVLDVIHGDGRLNNQVDTFVGTAQGGHHIEATSIGRRVLPRPNELDQLTEAFEKHYEDLEAFLAADEIEYTVIWPLPGLTSSLLPLQLDLTLELDAMSDRELGFALDTEIVRPEFPRQRLFNPRPEHHTCVRYRYNLPRLLGETDANENLRAGQEIEDRLRDIESALKEALAVVLPDAIGIAGRFGIVSEPESPLSGGIAFQQATLAQGLRLRQGVPQSLSCWS